MCAERHEKQRKSNKNNAIDQELRAAAYVACVISREVVNVGGIFGVFSQTAPTWLIDSTIISMHIACHLSLDTSVEFLIFIIFT